MTKNGKIIDALIQASTDVAKICKPLLASTPIKIVCYYEFRKNGDVYAFENHLENFREFAETGLLLKTVRTLPEWIERKGFSLLDLRSDQKLIRKEFIKNFSFQEKWLMGHECEYVVQKNNVIDRSLGLFYFYGDIENRMMNDFYINNTNTLKYFSSYFMKEINNLIRKLAPYPLFSGKEAKSRFHPLIENLKSMEISIPQFLFSFCKKKQLSGRQLEIVAWYLKGKTTDETAKILGIEKNTVETHIERIKLKLNCRSKPQIISELLKDGLFID